MVTRNNTITNLNYKCNVLFINIRSLRNKSDEIKAVAFSKTYDFIILNEIWLKNNELPFYVFDDYDSVASTREEAEEGGTMILLINFTTH